ncbi:cupin domain-containing protein [Flavisolibacter sp. BT320]|nr:cupin domain-containing protein [Flavisolibacter longurius]
MQAPGTTMRGLPGYGGMTVAFNEIPAGTDFSPLLQGLKNNSCHCPHWGYVVEGEMVVRYDDGSEETLSTGDVFYLPPGHTARVEKDLKFLDFSPEKELKEVMDHIARKVTAASA